MSYEIVKSISKKKDKIFITSASNNVSPKTYSKWEFMPDSLHNKEKVSNKELYLFHGIIGGSYKLNKSVNENWIYAENKFYEYCRENNISTSYIWELPYLNDGDIKTLKPYHEIFKKYYEEKIDGKYYLSSSLGQIIKVMKRILSMFLLSLIFQKNVKVIKKHIMIIVIFQNKVGKNIILK